jgi:hypothetical protein
MPTLILGPVLRYVGANEATIWVETDAPCEVEALDHRARTFSVEGHHYALVHMTDLEQAKTYEYTVSLDGKAVWPEPDSNFPPSVIRTFNPEESLKLVFGSCRVAMPHEPPYTLTKDEDERGFEIDALRALAFRMQHEPVASWPHALLLLGDQMYADEVSPKVREFIRSRRDPNEPPGEELANFEEYTRLYRDSWGAPDIRWLLSTAPSVMIFDDHDVTDDWNTSASWVADMRAKPWWDERIVGGFMSYWIYQHLGNLSPRELYEDKIFKEIQQLGPLEDAGPRLREFAFRADREPQSYRWSFYRDFDSVRLLVTDSRAGRILDKGRRDMLDEEEWQWIEERVRGDFKHLLLGTTLPVLLGPSLHYLEAWNEAVCAGAWGDFAAKQGEKIRRKLDLEHWSAFETSFKRMINLIRTVAAGEAGQAPATITILSGDVHHVYLVEASFLRNSGIQSAIHQAVCSPFRNPLGKNNRRVMRACWSKPIEAITRSAAHLAGVKDPEIRWHLTHKEPWFDNQVATLEMAGSKASISFAKSVPGNYRKPCLEQVFEYRLDKYG